MFGRSGCGFGPQRSTQTASSVATGSRGGRSRRPRCRRRPTAAAHWAPTAGASTPLRSCSTVTTHLSGMRSSCRRALASSFTGSSTRIRSPELGMHVARDAVPDALLAAQLVAEQLGVDRRCRRIVGAVGERDRVGDERAGARRGHRRASIRRLGPCGSACRCNARRRVMLFRTSAASGVSVQPARAAEDASSGASSTAARGIQRERRGVGIDMQHLLEPRDDSVLTPSARLGAT